MSLFKRGGVYWLNVYRQGRRYQQSTGTGNRRQAEAVLQKLKADLHANRFGIENYEPSVTVGAVTARFLAEGSPSKYHRERIEQFLSYFADTVALSMTKSLLEDYRTQRKELHGVVDATVNRDLSVLRRIVNWAVDCRILAANPLGRLRLARERRTRRPILNVADEERLLIAAPEYLRNIIVVALDTGMRRGEVLGQRYEDIDFHRNLLFVTVSKTPEGVGREIPLTSRVRNIFMAPRRKSGLVFTYHDKAISDVKKGWAAALKRAGLPHSRFHDLRHTFATRLVECNDVSADTRMSLMGHMSPHRVHARYCHVSLPLKRAAISQLEAWIEREKQKGEHSVDPETSTAKSQSTPQRDAEEKRLGEA